MSECGCGEEPVLTPDESSGLVVNQVTLEEGYREFKADFDTATHVKDSGLSLERRPDAISYDYLEAFSRGPLDIGDSSAGPINRTWRVHTDGYSVFYERENLLHNGYDPEQLLFSIPDDTPPILELDVSFDQNARILVCAERATGTGGALELWLYWFDPFAASFVFTSFGEGRSPKVLLDDLVSIFESDLLVFYCKDSTGVLCYRMQRDRYQTEYTTPFSGGELRYIEDAVRTRGNRIALILSLHDTVLGRYSLERHESTLYPYLIEPETIDTYPPIVEASCDELVLEHTLYDIDLFSMDSGTLITGVLEDTTPAAATDLPNEDWKFSITMLAGDTYLAVLSHTLYDIDTVAIAGSLSAGLLTVVVILHDVYDKDTVSLTNGGLVSGSLT